MIEGCGVRINPGQGGVALVSSEGDDSSEEPARLGARRLEHERSTTVTRAAVLTCTECGSLELRGSDVADSSSLVP